MVVKRVAIIGAGAAGAAAAAALDAEDYFDEIKVYERRETAGGTWIYDPDPGEVPFKPGALPKEIDPPLSLPAKLPSTTKPCTQNRFDKTPIYEELTTNVPEVAMCFTDVPFPYGPFVPHSVPKQYVENYFSWHRTDSSLVLNTTVEDLSRLPCDRWKLVLRKHDAAGQADDWWEEEFDAVIVANGHYSVPYVPAVPGLAEYIRKFPGRVGHSKKYRSPKLYAGQTVVVVGNSASGYDVTQQLLKSGLPKEPLYVSRRSRGRWDGDEPPRGQAWKPVITKFHLDGSIEFADGTVLRHVDKIVYCTGYKASYPFWNEINNGRPVFDYPQDRLINNFHHTFIQDFPTLGFIGLPRVLTFRSFEYQAVALTRYWSGRNSIKLPCASEQKEWENRRAELTRKQRRRFHQLDWDDGETMAWFRFLFEFAGLPQLEGHGRCPPVLGERTRWAIEHIKKYPEHRPREVDHASSADCFEVDDLWEAIGGSGRQKDSLYFI